MTELEEKYIKLLENALKRFYASDAKTLFKDKLIDERAMVGCIYRYMWISLQRNDYAGIEQDIDIEYDRMNNENGAAVKKSIENISAHKCYCAHDYDSCGKVIEKHKREHDNKCEECKNRPFRPDIIVHRRMSELGKGNGLVVEFKKVGCARRAKDFDIAKIKYCTCDGGDLRYKVGAFVELDERNCEVSIFINGEQKENSYRMNSHGRINDLQCVQS